MGRLAGVLIPRLAPQWRLLGENRTAALVGWPGIEVITYDSPRLRRSSKPAVGYNYDTFAGGSQNGAEDVNSPRLFRW